MTHLVCALLQRVHSPISECSEKIVGSQPFNQQIEEGLVYQLELLDLCGVLLIFV